MIPTLPFGKDDESYWTKTQFWGRPWDDCYQELLVALEANGHMEEAYMLLSLSEMTLDEHFGRAVCLPKKVTSFGT